MESGFSIIAGILLLAAPISHARGAAQSTTALAASPNPALFGQAVALTATVTTGATGSVTFYDGSSVLGVAALNNATAMFTTRLLPCCARILRARYTGDANHASALSPPVNLSVNVLPESGLAISQTFATGFNPQLVTVGDVNGDGIADLVIANAGDVTVGIFLGSGNGLFQPALSFVSGGNPYAIAIGDFNGDGKPDLAVANSADSTVSILLGNGNGTFQSPVAYAVGYDPIAIVAADFNNDGWLDLATANFGDGTVSVFLGNGGGTLQSAVTLSAGLGPAAIVAGDFNGDGVADLAVANSNDNTVTVLTGQGNGMFSAATQAGGGLGPSGIVTGDFNGDGLLDLAVADFGDYFTLQGGGVTLLLGNGNGTFRSLANAAFVNTPLALAAGDLNGDGKLDVVVADESGISIVAGNGDGSFQPPVTVSAGTSSISIALATFNGSALTGAAVANFNDNNVVILQPAGAACTFGLPSASFLLDAAGGSVNLNLISNSPGCPWTVAADPWLVSSGNSGMGGSSLSVTVEPNATGAPRTGALTVGGQTASVIEAATTQVFADVPLSAYYFDAVNLLKQKGITAGCSSTDFCPTLNITRAAMAIFVVRAIYGGDNFTASSSPYFLDVQATTFGFTWIQKMYELGVTVGCGGNKYCPDSAVTRDQMAIFIIRARLGATTIFDSPAEPYFADVPPGYWAFPWIQRLKMDNITAGCGGNNFCPGNTVSRGDMAIFIMRGAFNRLLPGGTPMITVVTPNSIPAGQGAAISVTGFNTHFVQDQTRINPITGIQFGPVIVLGPEALSVLITPSGNSYPPLSLLAVTGTEEAVLPNGLTIE